MKIFAGGIEIPINDMPYRTNASVDGKIRDCYKIEIDGAITEEQLKALSDNVWELHDGERVIDTFAGYDTLVDHKVTFAKIETKQDEIDAALKPVLDSLNDEQALGFTELYPTWTIGKLYAVGSRVKHDKVLYKCLTEHASQEDWTPDKSPALWARVLVSANSEILAWSQPDSTNPYMIGDKVTHNDKTWVSDVDNNVWEPSVYGWTEVV